MHIYNDNADVIAVIVETTRGIVLSMSWTRKTGINRQIISPLFDPRSMSLKKKPIVDGYQTLFVS